MTVALKSQVDPVAQLEAKEDIGDNVCVMHQGILNLNLE
jgi:hypothetical protein